MAARDILGFERKGSLLSQALGRGGGGALTAGTISFNAALQLGADDAKVAATNRSTRAEVNRTMRNYGKLLVERARTLTRRHVTNRSHVLISGWDYELDEVGIGGVRLPLRISLVNPAPYAEYVHPAGDRKRLVGHYMGGAWKRARAAELADSIKSLKQKLGRMLANQALANARKANRGRGGPQAAK